MTAIILVQSAESSDWAALPGTYPTFQDARDMFEFLRPTLGPIASVAIEDADDIAPVYGI